jgi:polar amino acid transport system permease protein
MRLDTSTNPGTAPPNWPGPESVAARIVEPPRLGRWLCLVAVAVGLTWIAYQLVTNPGFQWDIVGRYMLDATVLRGVGMTIQLTFLIMVIGVVIGVVVALMRMSRDPFLNFCAHGFVWFFRGTPVLVQLVFWYNLAALFPLLSLGIPFGGPKFFEISATVAISSFTAALLGLGLNEGAYMAEIIRAGLLSVDGGQTEASKALGHRPWQTFRVIVLPQAMKAIVPPTGNQLIGMLKYTSLASVVALHELMHSVETIYSRTFETMPMLIVAAAWYLIMVSVLSIVQFFIERHYMKGWQAEIHASLQA